jgi:hypothetical protein
VAADAARIAQHIAADALGRMGQAAAVSLDRGALATQSMKGA